MRETVKRIRKGWGRGILSISIIGMLATLLPMSASGAATAKTTATAHSNKSSFIWAIAGSTTSLDTSNFQSFPSQDVDGARWSLLVQYNETHPTVCTNLQPLSTVAPGPLVKSIKTTAGGTVEQFTLKPGMKSQAGNVLTSQDVLWSMNRILAVDAIGQFLLNLGGYNLKNLVTVTGTYTFNLNLTAPNAISVAILSQFFFEIYDKVAVVANSPASDPWGKTYLTSNIADFGPWKLQSFIPGTSVTYVPNPNWKGARGPVKTFEITTVASDTTRTQLMESGQANYTNGLTYPEISAVKTSSGGAVLNCASPNRDYVAYNFKSPVFSNPKVRQAISLATNRAALVKSVYHGYAKANLYGVNSAFGVTSGGTYYKYNVAKAKALLASAGYPNGFTFTLTYSPQETGAYSDSLAIGLKAQLAQAGITMNLNSVATTSGYTSILGSGSFDAYLYKETPSYISAGLSENVTLGCTANLNYGKYCNTTMDTLEESELTATTTANQLKYSNEISNLIDTSQPVDYIATVKSPFAVGKCNQNLIVNTQIQYVQIWDYTPTC